MLQVLGPGETEAASETFQAAQPGGILTWQLFHEGFGWRWWEGGGDGGRINKVHAFCFKKYIFWEYIWYINIYIYT